MMTLKEKIHRYFEKRDRKMREEEVVRRGSWHSRAYHKYFAGYTEYYVLDGKSGKPKIERIYTGVFYRQELSGAKYVWIRVLFAVLFLASAYCFFSGSMSDNASNKVWYAALPQVLCIPLLFYMMISLFSYLFAPRKMKIHDYNISSVALKRAALFASIAHALAALCTLGFIVAEGDFSGAVILSGCKFLIAAIFLFVVNRVEHFVEYTTIANPTKIPDYGAEIK